MNDSDIVKLYFERSEDAIAQSKSRYGRYCRYIAARILPSEQDVEEIENDTYMKAWSRIPPDRPDDLGAYLGMLCRQTAIDRYKSMKREKRGGGQYPLALEELSECLAARDNVEAGFDSALIRETLNSFLRALPEKHRVVFMRRYFWMSDIKEISESLGMSESAVKMLLMRTREKLKIRLEKEGIGI